MAHFNAIIAEMDGKIGAVILAAGRGTRLKSTTVNKVALPFHGKPIVEYAVNVMEHVADPVVVVVGAFADSVKDALKNHPNIFYAEQKEQLGTAHATKVGIDALVAVSPALVVVGYGDHMMFYKHATIQKLIDLHKQKNAVMSLITVVRDNPDELAWGRIIRDEHDNIVKSVEQKDASDSERLVKELNVGFYVFDYEFARTNIDKIPKSPVTGEYYMNSLIEVAVAQNKTVTGLVVPFEEVGIGINRPVELDESQKLHSHVNGS